MNMWLSQCNDFEHVLKPDYDHIGLQHVVQKKTELWVCESDWQESNRSLFLCFILSVLCNFKNKIWTCYEGYIIVCVYMYE
jgi:hypothetical protein